MVGLGLRSSGMLGGVVFGSCVPPFRDSLSVSFLRFKWSRKNAGQRVLTLLYVEKCGRWCVLGEVRESIALLERAVAARPSGAKYHIDWINLGRDYFQRLA